MYFVTLLKSMCKRRIVGADSHVISTWKPVGSSEFEWRTGIIRMSLHYEFRAAGCSRQLERLGWTHVAHFQFSLVVWPGVAVLMNVVAWLAYSRWHKAEGRLDYQWTWSCRQESPPCSWYDSWLEASANLRAPGEYVQHVSCWWPHGWMCSARVAIS